MNKKDIIKHLTFRANSLAACGVWNDNVEDAYWQIKKDLFEWERIWELEAPCFYWSQQMKNDLYGLHQALESVWRLKFSVG